MGLMMKDTVVLGLRYYGEKMKDYFKVKELAEKESVSLSEIGRILVNRGLHYTENPVVIEKPVEKIVYRDRVVIKEVIKEIPKIVYKEKPSREPRGEHLIPDSKPKGGRPLPSQNTGEHLLPEDKPKEVNRLCGENIAHGEHVIFEGKHEHVKG